MPDLILHHYASSPFSEKFRLVLGYKRLAWRSVTVPVMLPKPDVVALTGGYRRTPFLQVGADVYCDTALMCRVVEGLQPQPSLYPHESAGLAEIVAQWADSALFWSAVPLTLQSGGGPHVMPDSSPDFLKAFGADRAAMTAGMRRLSPPDAGAAVATYLDRLDALLADGRPFLLGALPCIADFSAAQSIWFMHHAPPLARQMAGRSQIAAWSARVTAFGHGTPTAMTSAEAIERAAATRAHAPVAVDAGLGYAAGEAVTVNPTDYGADPVLGTLVGLTRDSVTIERSDERAGTLHVHFPRIGFQIRKDAKEKAT
jgi:glutathione S-transferase